MAAHHGKSLSLTETMGGCACNRADENAAEAVSEAETLPTIDAGFRHKGLDLKQFHRGVYIYLIFRED